MAGPIVISILANGKQARSEFERTASTAGRIGGSVRKMALPAVAALGGLALAGKEAAGSLLRIEKINAQTANVVKSTGGAANVTASHVENLAGKIEGLTASEAEAVQEGANVLLTFTNIKNGVGKTNQVFDQTVTVVNDMSRALGTDLKQQSMQVGKALNDPIKGISALSRVGVAFTADQKAQIKTLTESGRTMEAQKIILAELNKEFGGSGKAYAKTTAGQIELMEHQWGTLTEELTATVMPVLMDLAKTGTKALSWASEHTGTVKLLVAALAALSAGVLVVNGVMKVAATVSAVYSAAQAVMEANTKRAAAGQWALNTALLANPIALVIVAIAALVAGLVIAYKKSETFRRIVNGAFRAVQRAAVVAFNWVKDNWPLLLAIITGPIGIATYAVVKNWGRIKSGASAVKDWIVEKFNALVGFVTGLPGRIGGAAKGMFSGIKNAFRDAINWIIDGWNSLSFTLPSIDTHIPGVGKVGGFTLSTPDIPRLARGGIVVAGDNPSGIEAIVPLERAAEMGFGGNTTITVHVHAPVGSNPAEIGRTLRGYLDQYAATGGRRRAV